MTEDAKQERRKWDAELLTTIESEQPPLKNAAATEAGEQFYRFEDLTRKLVQVPKSELDEKRKGSGSDAA